jgi:peptide/nickel transport system substrate-binding protein
MKRRSLPIGCTVLAVALGAAACGGSSSPTSSPTTSSTASTASTASAAAHRGGTFTMLWNSAGSSIDTGIDYDPNWFILHMTNDGLMGFAQVAGAAGTALVPDLATSTPTPTNGGKTYTFTLRPGIKFSNGAAVTASDVAFTIKREFTLPGPGVSFYASIEGGQTCLAHPAQCNLSKGIVTNNAARTVVFHLSAPDPNFLEELALPFAYVVPTGTPNKDIGTNPLPATGPYMIKSFQPNKEMELVRNPDFTQWSAAAQPAGNPNKIVMKIGLAAEDEVTQVENGQADWMYDQPPADRLNELATKYASQIHIDTTPNQYYMAMDTRAAPFNNLKVRQALNFATDRQAIVKIVGGSRLAQPSCQILPPNFPGYVANCPYTANPGTTWTAPDMAKAKQLIAASGTKGQKVVVVGTSDETTKSIDLYFVSLLQQLGYKASLKTLSSTVEYPYIEDSKNKPQLSFSYWSPDYSAAADFLNVEIGCAGFHAASTASPNLSEFCDPAIQRMTAKALTTQQTNPTAANAQWAQIDKAVTAQAPQITLYTANRLDFVSSRVGNFQWTPAVTSNFLIDQAWVK